MKSSRILVKSLSIFIICNFFQTTVSTCVPLNGVCDEECDCCGYDSDPAVKCELRMGKLGRRCYISGNIGRPCTAHSECKSQRCVNGSCVKRRRPFLEVPKCPLAIDEIIPINGLHPEFPEECANECEVVDKTGLVTNAVDGDSSTPYVNARALTSGMLLYPEKNAPVRELELCAGPDCPQCDPTCYKLEGYCSEDDTYSIISEEDFNFTTRGECLKFHLTTSEIHAHYKLTFPCQVETTPSCPVEVPGDCTCKNGLTPFTPEPKVDTAAVCNGISPSTSPMAIEYVSHSKVGDNTEIVYMMEKPGLQRSATYFQYAILPWDNNCCHECYHTYHDTNNDGVLDETDRGCDETCGSTADLDELLLKEDDENLCMQGIKVFNPQVVGSQRYFFKLVVAGDVTMMPKTYGMYLGPRRRGKKHIQYGEVLSPVCQCDKPTTEEGECLTYPMQIGEVVVSGKCNQLAIA